MALIASINGTTRRVYLDPAAAVGGVITFHPTGGLYAEYRTLRRTTEAYRKFSALLNASGNAPKGGGKFTPRYTLLLSGTKVVIPAGVPAVTITGELLTDDGSDPFDTSLVTGPCIIRYQPAEAEIIAAGAGGTGPSASDIVAAVLAQLNPGLIADAVWSKELT